MLEEWIRYWSCLWFDGDWKQASGKLIAYVMDTHKNRGDKKVRGASTFKAINPATKKLEDFPTPTKEEDLGVMTPTVMKKYASSPTHCVMMAKEYNRILHLVPPHLITRRFQVGGKAVQELCR